MRLATVLRLVPAAASGETIAPVDIAEALGTSVDVVDQHLSRAARAGYVVRVRFGAYVLGRPLAKPQPLGKALQNKPTPRQESSQVPAGMVTAKQAAALAGVSTQAVYARAWAGKMAYRQSRWQLLVPVAEIEVWLRERSARTGRDASGRFAGRSNDGDRIFESFKSWNAPGV